MSTRTALTRLIGFAVNLNLAINAFATYVNKYVLPGLALMVLLPLTTSYANAQTVSESPATSPRWESELRGTLQRALDKYEASRQLNTEQEAALRDAHAVIARQEGEKRNLEEVISYKDRALKAKDEALAAERDATMKLHTALQLSKDEIQNLRSDLKTQKKLTKWAFIIGTASGFGAALLFSK